MTIRLKYENFQPASDSVPVVNFISLKNFVSKKFLMKRYFGLTEEEIEENIRQWAEENAAKVK